MATSALPTGGMIDPTKPAEFPVLLGDRFGERDDFAQSRLFNLNYNHKTKSTNPQQRSTITRSSHSRDLYNLTITDRAQNTDNTLTYVYDGSEDPEVTRRSEEQDYVLVFDSDRKAYVLEPVVTRLNFNLRSAPAKSKKQVKEQYEQLRTFQEDQQSSGEDLGADSSAEDDGPADDSNPFDFRHFLPKADDEQKKSSVGNASPEPLPKPGKPDASPLSVATKPAKPRPESHTSTTGPPKEPAKKAGPLKKKEEPAKKTEPQPPKPSSKPEAQIEVEEPEDPESKSTPSDTGTAALSSFKAVPSPGSNIIVDGDLIIDMGSPPPSRPAFNINPAHFSSNGTPANGAEDDEDEEMENLQLPSPVGHTTQSAPTETQQAVPTSPAKEEEAEDDDALAAEMEAAFEESALEEETAHIPPYQQPSRQYHAASEDESEVSEEE